MFRSGNPALKRAEREFSVIQGSGNPMTIEGAINKSLIVMFCTVLTALGTWTMTFDMGLGGLAMMIGIGGAIVGLITALVLAFGNKEWGVFLAPIYGLAEGTFLGAISAVFEAQYPGIVFNAVGLTLCILGGMLVLYRAGIIKVTEKFRAVVFTATLGIGLMYLVSFVMSFFGMPFPFLHDSGPIGIGLSVFIVIIAALNLNMDFELITQGARQGWAKHMEWYAAFALMVTLVWLYIEVLRLLAKLQRR